MGRCRGRGAPGERILDLCAAPGGKATAMAATAHSWSPPDLQQHRARPDRENVARRARRSWSPTDAPPFRPGAFDRVLLDAPCSGLGALRRRADARWRITEADVGELVELQRTHHLRGRGLVRPGGWLVYSVCTLTAEESIDHPVPPGFEVVTERTVPRLAAATGTAGGCCHTTTAPTAWSLIRYRRAS